MKDLERFFHSNMNIFPNEQMCNGDVRPIQLHGLHDLYG